MDFEKIKKAFLNNGFEVSTFDTKEQASEYLNKEIDKKTVGFGGSVTLDEMKLYDSLSTHNTIFSHWNVQDGKTATDMINEAMTSDIYITSANAVSENGEIVNIDGRGNRASSTLYGHKKVYIVIGKNKIESDLEKAIFRARNIAAPKNAQRLKTKTPCAIKGDKCYNCNSKDRICNALIVHYKKMLSCDMEIVIINENLGF